MRLAPALGASLVAGIAATSWTALTLAEFGRFTAVVPLAAFFLAAAAVFVLLRRGAAPGEAAFFREDLLAIGIACATLALTLPPDEIIVGGQDPGVYVHVAASVARTGSVMISDPDIAAFDDEERGLVARNYAGIILPFAGMWQLPDGRTSPQFFHLFPSLMAVAWPLGGVRAALIVNPLLNVAAVLALYALASQLLGRRWALAAALVHALACAQIRQARFPTAEMLTQLLLLAGVAMLAAAMRRDSPLPALAPLAGAALGLSVLARFDAVVFLAILYAVLVWGMGPAGATRPVLAAAGVTGVFVAHALAHQHFITPLYLPLGHLLGRVLPAAAVLLAAALLARRAGLLDGIAREVRRRELLLRLVVAALVGAWVIFGWVARPRLAGAGRVGHLFRTFVGEPPWSGVAALLAGEESRNALFLVDLLGALGVVAMLAGIAFLIVTQRQLWGGAWLAASAALLAATILNVYHDHFLMWVSRRFVPVIMPLASVAIAAAAAMAARAGGGRLPAAAGVALIGAVLWLNAGPTLAMAREREWPGLIAWYERLEAAVPADAAVYSDQPGFAAPLRYISGRRAYELSARSPERVERLIALMRRKAGEGREVLYLSQQPFYDPAAAGLVPLASHPLSSSMLVNTKRGVPLQSKSRGADFVLYRVVPSGPREER